MEETAFELGESHQVGRREAPRWNLQPLSHSIANILVSHTPSWSGLIPSKSDLYHLSPSHLPLLRPPLAHFRHSGPAVNAEAEVGIWRRENLGP